MLPQVERFFEAFRASLLEPKRGMKVRLLTYSHSATKDVTHEVREVQPPTSLQGRAMYFGTRKNWQHGDDWESGPWSVQTNIPCRECNGTGSLWVEASYPECAEELAEYFADDPGAEPDPLNLETA